MHEWSKAFYAVPFGCLVLAVLAIVASIIVDVML
jgi:hypothetical protein